MTRPLLAAILMASACQGGAPTLPPTEEARSSLSRETDPMAPATDVAAIVAANNGFGSSLYRALAEKPGNLLFSPYGLAFNMAMLREGLSSANKTGVDAALGFSMADDALDRAFDALDLSLNAIGGKTSTGSGQQLLTASAVWSAMAPAPGYLDTLAKYYGTGVLIGDNPGQVISDWEATLPGEGPLPFALAGPCVFALVSYVHLDAAWEHGFDVASTRADSFTRLDGSTVSAPTLHTTQALSIATNSPRAVELPYDGGALSLVVIVPDDSAAFDGALSPAVFDDALSRLHAVDQVALSLPKLSYRTSSSVLEAMQGMGLPLDSGHWQIWHAADLTVDENGTVATAITTTSMTPSAVIEATPFAVDRPFFFAIRDRRSGALLFMGRVVDPTL